MPSADTSSTTANENQAQTTRRGKSLTLGEYRDALRELEGKIHKAAGLELELIDRAVLLREKRRRLLMSRELIKEQLRVARDGDKTSS